METSSLLLIGFTAAAAYLMYQRLSAANPQKLKEMLENGALLIDVRSPGEFANSHVKGSKNIPVNTLHTKFGEIGDKTKGIVVYCASGARSARAASILRKAGFTHVENAGPMGRVPQLN